MRMKTIRAGLLFDVALIFVVFFLVYSLLHERDPSSSSLVATIKPIPDTLYLDLQPNDRVQGGQRMHPVAAADSSPSIDSHSRIKLLDDARSKSCRRLVYASNEKATVVIDFTDYEFYDVKNTIVSIVNDNNYKSFVEEIIVVDDGSTLDYIRRDAEKYLKMVPRARMLRQATQVGTTRARLLAMKETKTDIIVFLEPNVICNHGWLEPLMDLLVKNHELIAVPHHDRINNPISVEYERTPDSLVAAPTWNFAIKMRATKVLLSAEKKFRFYYDSPAVRGNAFAVRKSFLDSIGSFDVSYEDSGAEMLELSLRTWMCGGAIVTVTCSRVGIINLQDDVRSKSEIDCRRTAGLWYGQRREMALRIAGVNNSPRHTEETGILERLTDVKAKRTCRDIDWYLENVANDSVLPSYDAVKFGTIATMSGRCGRVGDDDKVELVECADIRSSNVGRNAAKVIFEMTKSGQLKSMGKCLTTEQNAYIALYECRPDDKQQAWTFDGNRLRNVWSDYCATHVTDPNRSRVNRQIMMAQKCFIADPDHRVFNQWQFQTV